MARSVSESLLSTIVLHLATIPHRTYTPPPFHMLSHPAYNVSTRRTRMQLVGRRRPRCHCNCREHSLPVPPSVACHSLVAPAPERADRRRPDPKRTLRQGTNMDACSTRPPLSPCIVPWAPRHFFTRLVQATRNRFTGRGGGASSPPPASPPDPGPPGETRPPPLSDIRHATWVPV